jgi:hypothetical protein
MALIKSFERCGTARVTVRSEVDCGWNVGTVNGREILHLETYGSADRAIPGKVSQSIEFDEDAAAELIAIIHQAFPRLSRR